MKVSAYVASKINRTKKDFKVDHFTAGVHAGGSGKDTSNTGVRITDHITGISAEAQRERSQRQNLHEAFYKLAEKLAGYYAEEERQLRMMKTENEAPVRHYNERRNQVKDARLPGKEYDMEQILNGRMEELLGDLIHQDV